MGRAGRPEKGVRRRRAPAAPGRTARAPNGASRAWVAGAQVVGASLERRLQARVAQPLQVRVTDNVHTMLSFSRQGEVLQVRLHHMFVHAGPTVVEALARYIRGADTEASAALDRFIQHNRRLIRRVPAHVRQRRVRIHPQGRWHDLQAIFDGLNARFFGGAIGAAITWGPAPRALLPRKSIKLGSYSADARLIRIHPALDQAAVPRFFVEWIVFHEMLHHRHGVRRREGRRCIHTERFLAEERAFPHYEAARRWETENLDLLLSWAPGSARHPVTIPAR